MKIKGGIMNNAKKLSIVKFNYDEIHRDNNFKKQLSDNCTNNTFYCSVYANRKPILKLNHIK